MIKLRSLRISYIETGKEKTWTEVSGSVWESSMSCSGITEADDDDNDDDVSYDDDFSYP